MDERRSVSNDVLVTQIAALDRHLTAEIGALRRETSAAQETAARAVAVAAKEAEDRLKAHNGLIEQMREQARAFATKDAVEQVQNWQARLTGGLIVIAVIGIVNLAKLWFS
jgi:hypothetical protein